MFSKYKKELLVSRASFNNKDFYIKKDIYYPLTIEEKNNINVKLLINDKDTSEIVVTLKNKEIIHEKVYYYNDDSSIKKEKNIFTKIRNFFDKIF